MRLGYNGTVEYADEQADRCRAVDDVCILLQNGYTALHIAAKKNQMDIVSTLVEHGARTSAQSRVRSCLR